MSANGKRKAEELDAPVKKESYFAMRDAVSKLREEVEDDEIILDLEIEGFSDYTLEFSKEKDLLLVTLSTEDGKRGLIVGLSDGGRSAVKREGLTFVEAIETINSLSSFLSGKGKEGKKGKELGGAETKRIEALAKHIKPVVVPDVPGSSSEVLGINKVTVHVEVQTKLSKKRGGVKEVSVSLSLFSAAGEVIHIIVGERRVDVIGSDCDSLSGSITAEFMKKMILCSRLLAWG